MLAVASARLHSSFPESRFGSNCNLSILDLSSLELHLTIDPSLATMNPRELVDHIRSGPAALVLLKALRFRRRARSNPCDFTEFLQVLQSSETIRSVQCGSQLHLGISEDEWVLLVQTLWRIKDIQNLTMHCSAGSRDFHHFQVVADGVNNAHSLRELRIGIVGAIFPRDPSGLTALANALRDHTNLQAFNWADPIFQMEAAPISGLDPVLLALPACPNLRMATIMTRYASADAMKNLLQLQSTTELLLVLTMEQWLAVADEIRCGRCNIRFLHLAMLQGAQSEATEAVKALASAIRLDRNLERIVLQMENGFTNEAGVALAEALAVNKTLCRFQLSTVPVLDISNVQNTAALGTQAYEAFSAMLRVNTSLRLKLPPFEKAGADERLRESRKQMHIEKRLNKAGRGRLLASTQTTGEEWVDALLELSSKVIDDPPAFQISCLYSLLRLNPSVVCVSSS
jgi:hypothetical protein